MDNRLQLTGALPLGYHLGGLLAMDLGYALFLRAMACNTFFSEGVRIQTERDHSVTSSGPYHNVRHPGYVGAILSQEATPFEDKTLSEELPGYQEYARQTRYRLLPGAW